MNRGVDLTCRGFETVREQRGEFRRRKLLDDALTLREEDRIELVDALIASLESRALPFDEAWRSIIERRSVELQSGQVLAVPWSEVRRQARADVS